MAKAPNSRSRPPVRSVPPGPVIASGILLILFGGAATAFGVAVFAATRGGEEASGPVIGLGTILFLGLPVIATGAMILRLSNVARITGIVFAGLFVIYNNPVRPAGFGLSNALMLAASVFIIWALIRYRGAFRRARDR